MGLFEEFRACYARKTALQGVLQSAVRGRTG